MKMEALEQATAAIRDFLVQLDDQTWLDQFLQLLRGMPPILLIAILLVPVVLAILSRRSLAVIASSLFALLCWFALSNFSIITTMAAPLFYIFSLVVGLAQAQSARRYRRLTADLAATHADVERLLDAEARRVLAGLRDANPVAPGSMNGLVGYKQPVSYLLTTSPRNDNGFRQQGH